MSRPASPTLIVAATAAFAVLLGSAAASTRAADASVSIVDFAFQPDTLEIPSGATVTWTVTRAQEPHTVTPVDPPDAFVGSGLLRQGDTFSATLAQPGTYRYQCSIHPEEMQGTVVVMALATTSPTSTPAAASASPSPPAPNSTSAALPPSPTPPAADGSQPPAGLSALGIVLAAAAALGALAVWVVVRARRRRS